MNDEDDLPGIPLIEPLVRDLEIIRLDKDDVLVINILAKNVSRSYWNSTS